MPSKNILILMALKFPFRELLLIIFGVLIGGLFFLISSPPKGNPITLLPSPTQVPIKVYITGAIKNPGTYELEKDSRLSDLIEKAGGLIDPNTGDYNLASKLYDGQQIQIQALSEIPLKSTNLESIKVNINDADSNLLTTLPGIGPTKANDIVQYREEFGFFDEIEDILNVPGIGEITFNQIKDLITTNQIQN
jgi:competence protein ComEA